MDTRLFGITSTGTREELIERLVDFALSPSVLKDDDEAPAKKAKKST